MEAWQKALSGYKLSPEILNVLEGLQFTQPTPVQTATIPLLAQNKDVVVEAVTGSGKTLAFLIPILEILKRRKAPFKSCEIGAFVVSPTRELAKQIGEALVPFLPSFGVKSAVFTGGSGDVQKDAERFRLDGANIVIGTPGRLEDLLAKYPDMLSTKSVEVFVLDEADRLLEMGFERSVNNIISKMPKQRRTGLFSATMTSAVDELIRAGLRNPMRVTVKVESGSSAVEQKIPETLKIFYHLCSYEERLAKLLGYLKTVKPKKTIVYFGTCACVDYFTKAISQLKNAESLKFIGLHGRMEHRRRTNVYKEFTDASSAILLCTDLAARGLDFPDIDLVIQFDAPQDPASFVHRCGRTARSGREGQALLFLDPSEEAYVDLLEGRKIPISLLADVESPDFLAISNELITINASDRELYEKSLRAFVSYMRFYQEHHAKFIFVFKNLDVGNIARLFGLLHLPKMPELKQFKSINFTKSDVDVAKIKFKDKTREKQRKVSIARRQAMPPEKPIAKKNINEAWSNKNMQKEKRLDRRAKKDRKRAAIQSANQSKELADSGQGPEEEDSDDLDEDYRAFKREKKMSKHGKISKDDLDGSDLTE